MLKAKIKAALIHGGITLVIAIITATLVYRVWYPGAFAQMLSGTDLYLLVLYVEICLGPLMSLVIYNPNKSRSELVRDYFFVGFVQLAALIYGLYSVTLSRPVYLVFVKDRIEIVAATELSRDDLILAKDQSFKSLPWFGPQNICTESPTDPQEKSDLLLSGASGKDIQLIPKYYRHCYNNEVIGKSKPKAELLTLTHIKLNDLPGGLQSVDFQWLPVVTRFNSSIVIYLNGDVNSPHYVNLDPFE